MKLRKFWAVGGHAPGPPPPWILQCMRSAGCFYQKWSLYQTIGNFRNVCICAKKAGFLYAPETRKNVKCEPSNVKCEPAR